MKSIAQGPTGEARRKPLIDTLLSCQTEQHGMAATTCRLLHLPLSPLYKASLDKCCIPIKKERKRKTICFSVY